MRATGVVRRIDNENRIKIPKVILEDLNLKEGSPLEIFTDKGKDIILRRYDTSEELMAGVDSLEDVISNCSIYLDEETMESLTFHVQEIQEAIKSAKKRGVIC